MPRWRPSWSDARTWFVSVRLLEAAAVGIVASGAVAMYTRWDSVDQPGMTMPDGSPIAFTFWDRVAITAGSIWLGPEIGGGMLMAAALVVVGVAILHRVRGVQNARLLRWELLGVGAQQVLASLVTVFMWVVAGLVKDPYHQANQDPNVVTSDSGAPDVLVVALGNLGVPVASVLVGVVAGLWWLRLPSFDDDHPAADSEPAALADDPPGDAASEGRVGRRAGWRPRPAPEAGDDDLSLDGVEQIEPVERLSPRDGDRPGDGGSSSGYEDYFRRF
jgi:hypothetical protein